MRWRLKLLRPLRRRISITFRRRRGRFGRGSLQVLLPLDRAEARLLRVTKLFNLPRTHISCRLNRRRRLRLADLIELARSRSHDLLQTEILG